MDISLNKVILIGKVNTSSYAAVGSYNVIKINLVVNREYALRDGTTKTESLYIDVAGWGKLAELSINENDYIYVDGSLRLEKWTDQTGMERRKHTVKADIIKKLEFNIPDEKIDPMGLVRSTTDKLRNVPDYEEDYLPF